ncbi:alpha-2-macroglobulin receptor-associated protein [Elysia marginata]|uniref:Alpha-2-macroglobulin receptor-associated protein n=1 Tax=Elysia marginata TaxID=1093978 RepID=A0AAV4HEP7_9GAST|nr:alpha-2-macroglobulin receptor-associated protein [Elysia marginata]
MQKVNLLWAKGKKKLSSAKLADLYAELSVHDKYEGHLKKMRAANKDEDGTLEAKVLKSYTQIVEHFGLEEPGKRKLTNPTPFDEEDMEMEKETQFEDTKLQSMWRAAQQAGFSKKDLIMLKEEFQHQQMRINEFSFLVQELGGNPDLLEDEDPFENNVSPLLTKETLTAQELKERELVIRENHTVVKEGYEKLETLLSTVTAPEPAFQDNRVYKLWAMAKKTDWSQRELDSFKEELKHFEHRLSKLTYYKDQLEQSEDAIMRFKEKGLEVPEKHQKLIEKNEFLDRTVNKLYADLKSKITKSLKHMDEL